MKTTFVGNIIGIPNQKWRYNIKRHHTGLQV